MRIFKSVSKTSDLSKYTQYIAIPLYCKSGNLLGVFQIVTKYDYVIETDKQKMIQFINDMIIPFANLIVLLTEGVTTVMMYIPFGKSLTFTKAM